MEDYNQDDYLPECKNCHSKEFGRERNYFEREYLILEEDGCVLTDSSDMEGPTTDWKYICYGCLSESDDLEDLLTDKPFNDGEGDFID